MENTNFSIKLQLLFLLCVLELVSFVLQLLFLLCALIGVFVSPMCSDLCGCSSVVSMVPGINLVMHMT
jgi:hypothetical protein